MIQNQPQEDNIYLFHIQYYHRTGLMPAATDNPVYAPHRTESNLMTKCLSVECCKEKLVSYTSFIKSVYPRTQELCVRISAHVTAHDQKARRPAYSVVNFKTKTFFRFSSFMHFSKLPAQNRLNTNIPLEFNYKPLPPISNT